jgi:hypothetical protein
LLKYVIVIFDGCPRYGIIESNKIEMKFDSILDCINKQQTSIKTKMSDTTSQFLKEYLVPNFYTKEDFDEMEDWSDERFEKFKQFMSKLLCAHDPFREIVIEYMEEFNAKSDEEGK